MTELIANHCKISRFGFFAGISLLSCAHLFAGLANDRAMAVVTIGKDNNELGTH